MNGMNTVDKKKKSLKQQKMKEGGVSYRGKDTCTTLRLLKPNQTKKKKKSTQADWWFYVFVWECALFSALWPSSLVPKQKVKK